jgi:hypothetical protein
VRRRERGSSIRKAHANSRPNSRYRFDQHRAVIGWCATIASARNGAALLNVATTGKLRNVMNL